MRTLSLTDALRLASRGTAATALVAIGLASTPPATAHRLLYPKRDSVVITAERIRASIQMALDGEETRALRDRYDRDADGRLSDAEAEAAAQFLAGRARRDFRVEIDGRPLSLKTTGVSSGGLSRRPGAAPHASVTVLLEAPLPGGESFELAIADRSSSPLDGAVPLDLRLEDWRAEAPPELRAEPGEREGVMLLRGLRLETGRAWRTTLRR